MNGDCLLVVHSHWRVGGVRSVIEKTLPAIIAETNVARVVMISGETAPEKWMTSLQIACGCTSIEEQVCPQIGYVSEMDHPPGSSILRSFWREIIRKFKPLAVWWHNPALGRNIPAVNSLLRENEKYHIPLLFHHHDLWCDHRWNRWPEMQACGYNSVTSVAHILFPCRSDVTHLTINSRDYRLFRSHLGRRVVKMGNPFDPPIPVGEKESANAKAWLEEVCEVAAGTPIWLAPARLLRRKNLLESLLLMLRMQPQAVLVTSDQFPSRDELRYANVLHRVAANRSSRFRLINLNAPGAPRMPALHAAANILIQSSIQEGFGLLFLEAAWQSTPLICRKLANVWPDLAERGLHFPMSYNETFVELSHFDKAIERESQQALFGKWRKCLPAPWRSLIKNNPLSSQWESATLPFSKLTLQSQYRAVEKTIASTSVVPEFSILQNEGQGCGKEFSTLTYARKFSEILKTSSKSKGTPAEASEQLQESIVRDALMSENLFPLLLEGQ